MRVRVQYTINPSIQTHLHELRYNACIKQTDIDEQSKWFLLYWSTKSKANFRYTKIIQNGCPYSLCTWI